MQFFELYKDPSTNFNIWVSLLFFVLFVVLVLVGKLARDEDCYSKMNRLHLRLFLPYVFSTFVYAFFILENSSFSSFGLVIGSFLYFSLHYIYLFALVGLARKSISINVLMSIKALSTNGVCHRADLLKKFTNKKGPGTEQILENRLKQMELLGLAQTESTELKITPKGKFMNKLGNTVLKVWKLART